MKAQNPSHTKVSCKFGAPMGRESSPLTGKVWLQHVALNSGGYDRGGAYWGLGRPLYVAWDTEGFELYLRADCREGAKASLQSQHGNKLVFYR